MSDLDDRLKKKADLDKLDSDYIKRLMEHSDKKFPFKKAKADPGLTDEYGKQVISELSDALLRDGRRKIGDDDAFELKQIDEAFDIERKKSETLHSKQSKEEISKIDKMGMPPENQKQYLIEDDGLKPYLPDAPKPQITQQQPLPPSQPSSISLQKDIDELQKLREAVAKKEAEIRLKSFGQNPEQTNG